MIETIHTPDDKAELKEGIEITPAMIEAGVNVFYDLDMLGPGEDELRKAVTRCFLAMLRSSPKCRCDAYRPALEDL